MRTRYTISFEILCDSLTDPTLLLDAATEAIGDLRGHLDAVGVERLDIDEEDVAVEPTNED